MPDIYMMALFVILQMIFKPPLRLWRRKGLGEGLSSTERNLSFSYISEDVSSFDLLGSPIGPPSHCESTMAKRVNKIRGILERLPDLEDAQMETTILCHCLALPKVSFALRTFPPQYIQNSISDFDDAMGEALSILLVGHSPNGPD